MQCPKCGFTAHDLDIYRMVELPETFGDRVRWQKDEEHRRTLEFYAWFLSAFEDARVLDLGAGPGTVAVPLSRLDNVEEVVCLDKDEEARRFLESAKADLGASKITVTGGGDPWALPFNDTSFDVVVCRYAMHHFEDKQGTLREISRCLRPHGVLLFSDPVMPNHSRDTTHPLYVVRQDSFHGYLTYHETVGLLSECGFRIMAARSYDYQRGTLDNYLADAENALRDELIRGWCSLDEKTKSELKWSGRPDGLFITYPVVDIAAAV